MQNESRNLLLLLLLWAILFFVANVIIFAGMYYVWNVDVKIGKLETENMKIKQNL